MADQDASERESTEELGDEHTEKRREFLKSAASVAVTTTAVTLMLSAGTKLNRAAAASPDGVDPTDADVKIVDGTGPGDDDVTDDALDPIVGDGDPTSTDTN